MMTSMILLLLNRRMLHLFHLGLCFEFHQFHFMLRLFIFRILFIVPRFGTYFFARFAFTIFASLSPLTIITIIWLGWRARFILSPIGSMCWIVQFCLELHSRLELRLHLEYFACDRLALIFSIEATIRMSFVLCVCEMRPKYQIGNNQWKTGWEHERAVKDQTKPKLPLSLWPKRKR